MAPGPDAEQLIAWLRDARARTLALVDDLDEAQLLGPRLPIVNPPRWEVGHVGWFQELWILRHALGGAPRRSDGDALYDSSAVAHHTRWDLPLPSRAATFDDLAAILEQVEAALRGGLLDEKLRYFAQLALFHEDMHGEALLYTRQTHGWPAPPIGVLADEKSPPAPIAGDARVPGGRHRVGAEDDGRFVFDNEKWAHAVELAPFSIARTAVSDGDLAAFTDDGGYRRENLWSEAGWRWRVTAAAEQPLYLRHGENGWERRRFDRWVELAPERAAIHVGWYEAEAFCNWAGRRLPSENEWEVAAAWDPSRAARRFPWGDDPPIADRARLDATHLATGHRHDLPRSDGALGCRQMIGNAWEWTASDFLPYPGFVADPYRDYSQPWFGTHKVLRGGCFATRARLLRNSWRNFYPPDRRDVFAGFRTCAR